MRSKLWLVPVIYAVTATVAGFAIPRLESLFPALSDVGISAGAAEAFLTTTAGGMMALTGIVFSVGLVMVQFGATAYSPRLVVVLARDPVLFHAMGLFTATFLFSLATILRTERAGAPAPTASIGVVVVLLLASMVLFARLVHELSQLQIGPVLRKIGAQGRGRFDRLFPHPLAPQGEAGAASPTDLAAVSQSLRHAGEPEVVTGIDIPALARLAAEAGAVIVVECAVGDTLVTDAAVLSVHGAARPVPAAALLAALRLGSARSSENDLKYPLRLLVDIAIRALSPAVNDPTTAVQALDQIEDLLRRLAVRRLPDGRALDSVGVLRVVYPAPTWEDYLSLGFDEIREFGVTSVQVIRRLRSALAGLADTAAAPERRGPVLAYLDHLDRAVAGSGLDVADQATALRQDRQGLGLSRG